VITTVAVLSGPERRRRWTSAEKLRIVEESLAGEANVAEVARRHDVHPNLLHGWRRQARAGVLTCAVERGTAPDSEASFASVAVVPEPPAFAAPVQSAATGVIEIELASGTRLRISGAVEPATVSAVIAALAGRRR
jgi:transposase